MWPPNYGEEEVIQPSRSRSRPRSGNGREQSSGSDNTPTPSRPSWGVLGPIPPIITILLAAATATGGSYLATRERLIIAEERIGALQAQVADLKSDISYLRELMYNQTRSARPALFPLLPSPVSPLSNVRGKKVTVTHFPLTTLKKPSGD
jgi:hypothetical protein